MNIYSYETAIGRICIKENNGAITRIDIGSYPMLQENNICTIPIIQEAKNQIDAYLKGKLQVFSGLKLEPEEETPFMRKVWDIISNIPYGKFTTYKELAKIIGNSNLARAVGFATSRNPICIIVPCHRVLGSKQKLVGYRGGLEVKKKLLEIEGIQYNS